MQATLEDTLREIEALADIGYKAIIPEQFNCNKCVLGAAVLGKTGKSYSATSMTFASNLGISASLSEGIMSGFDDSPTSWLCNFQNNEELKASYNFGKRMRQKYLTTSRE